MIIKPVVSDGMGPDDEGQSGGLVAANISDKLNQHRRQMSEIERGREEGHILSLKERITLFRWHVWEAFEDPQSSKVAAAINLVVILLILFSTVSFCVETLPQFDPLYPGHTDAESETLQRNWFWIETIVVGIFSLEYLLRFSSCPAFWSFLTNRMNLVDVIAILPYYIELIVGSQSNLSNLRVFRTIRLLRIFRIFKMSRRSEHFAVFAQTMQRSWEALTMLLFFIIIATIVFSGVLQVFESGEWDSVNGHYVLPTGEVADVDHFESVPKAAWWAVTTLTTVGYGDAVPKTLAGRLFSPFAMLGGLLVLAMPLGIIGENLMSTYRNSSLGRRSSADPEIIDPKQSIVTMRRKLDLGVQVRKSLIKAVNNCVQAIGKCPSAPPVKTAEREFILAFWKTIEALETSLHHNLEEVEKHLNGEATVIPKKSMAIPGHIEALKSKQSHITSPKNGLTKSLQRSMSTPMVHEQADQPSPGTTPLLPSVKQGIDRPRPPALQTSTPGLNVAGLRRVSSAPEPPSSHLAAGSDSPQMPSVEEETEHNGGISPLPEDRKSRMADADSSLPTNMLQSPHRDQQEQSNSPIVSPSVPGSLRTPVGASSGTLPISADGGSSEQQSQSSKNSTPPQARTPSPRVMDLSASHQNTSSSVRSNSSLPRVNVPTKGKLKALPPMRKSRKKGDGISPSSASSSSKLLRGDSQSNLSTTSSC